LNLNKRPIFLVHGLWNDPKLFEKLIKKINEDDYELYRPHLPHRFGKTSLKDLARALDSKIEELVGPEVEVDIVGFSMGGLISRLWLQNHGGFLRTKRFFSIGTPHFGTYTAQMIPSSFMPGIADMKRGSRLLSQLNNDLTSLEQVECISFFTKWDLMTFPGWQAKLSIGESYQLPVLTHKELITNSISLDILVEKIFKNT
jgi:triacylglycerol lipase